MDQKENLVEERKLIKCLYELCKENFTLSDDTILDKLYIHIQEKTVGNDFLQLLPHFVVWLEYVLSKHNTLSDGVKVLSIRLIGLVGSEPQGFTTIKHILPEVVKLISSSETQADSSLMVSLLNDLALFLNHEEGLNWVLKTGIWKHAVKSFFDDRSIYVNRSGVKLIALLLSKVDNNSIQYGVEILNSVCEPLVDNGLLTVTPLPNLERHDIYFGAMDISTKHKLPLENLKGLIKDLTRAAKFLCDILDELFISDSNLPVKLKCNFTPDNNFENCSSSQDYQTILQLLVLLELSNAHWEAIPRECDSLHPWVGIPCYMMSLYDIMYQSTSALWKLGHFNSLLDFCVFCLSRVHGFIVTISHGHIFKECSKCKKLEALLTQYLIIFLQLENNVYGDNCDNGPMLNMLTYEGSSCTQLQDCAHSVNWKEFNKLKSCETSRFQIVICAIFTIERSLNFIYHAEHRDAISLVVIKTLNLAMRDVWSEKTTMHSVLLHLITLTIKITEKYTKQFKTKYFELFTMAPIMLNEDNHDPRLTICVLQLINKVLEMLVMPDLIYCHDENGFLYHLNSKMSKIACSLMENLENPSNWEIRDTALEVYQSFVGFRDLFPKSFNILFHERLCNLVLNLAANDASPYVRASAFNFFSKAVRAKHLLCGLSFKHLSDLGAKTLLEDEMPEPRMAACNLLAALYVTHHLADEGKCYEAVFVASTKELDWEVKKATLRFWQCVIIKQLADEKIPIDPVLLKFSTTHNPLTKEDAVIKILRVMDFLNEIGCFKVIWSDVNDDSDISVSEEASFVIDILVELDGKWAFIEKVIDEFHVEPGEESSNSKRLNSKDFFTQIRQKDWREKLAARKNWIEKTSDDLSSLLDHILNPEVGDWDHNAVDCY